MTAGQHAQHKMTLKPKELYEIKPFLSKLILYLYYHCACAGEEQIKGLCLEEKHCGVGQKRTATHYQKQSYDALSFKGIWLKYNLRGLGKLKICCYKETDVRVITCSNRNKSHRATQTEATKGCAQSRCIQRGKAATETIYTLGNLSVTRGVRLRGIHCPQRQIFSARDKVKGTPGPRQANDCSQR